MTWHLQWSVCDQSKQHILVVNELLSAVDRSVHQFFIITAENMHYATDHTQAVASRSRYVPRKWIVANCRRISRII